jgi:hypothetical protein
MVGFLFRDRDSFTIRCRVGLQLGLRLRLVSRFKSGARFRIRFSAKAMGDAWTRFSSRVGVRLCFRLGLRL